jgi:hypothetical protein
VLGKMKGQSRLSVCPHQVSHYLFCMTNIHKTIPEQHGALDTTRGTEDRSQGVAVRLGAGQLALYRWHKRCTYSSSWKLASPGVWSAGLGSCCCSLSSLYWAPAGGAGSGHPHSHPASGYTSVEKYSVFRFSSAKEMGGCCR